MRTSLFVSIYLLVISCNLAPTEAVPDTEEVVVARIQGVKAYIDAEMIDKKITLFLDLDESFNDIDHLLPIETDRICDLLAEEFYSFSFADQAGCASNLYGRYGLRIHRGNERVQVIISGDILPEGNDTPEGYLPFRLKTMEKPIECPVEWRVVDSENHFQETPWRFVGFVTSEGEIYSHPACEEDYLGVHFTSQLVNQSGTYINTVYPEALLMSIKSFVWFEAQGGTKAYMPLDNNRFIATFGRWTMNYWPGPATRDRDNLYLVPKRMKDKYDSLNTLLSTNDTISYQINKNTMRLHNPDKGLDALFVAEAKD
nr:hypothetical protein [Cytophagales bacterium]